jgi:aspartate kinase
LSLVVQKYGGTSVADLERIRHVAARVARHVRAGERVCVVPSAMAGETNKLVGYVDGLDARGFDPAEYDAVVASGEQVTAGLLAIALGAIGVPARSFTGWQAGVRTDDAHGKARILEIDPGPVIDALDRARSRSSPAFRAWPRATASRPSAAAARTPRPSPWQRHCTPNAATSSPTSTASTPAIRGS